MVLAEKVSKGSQAKRLLNDPLTQEFIQRSKQQLIDRWEATPSNAVDERETIHSQVSALKALVDWLTQLSRAGDMAQAEINKLHQA